MLTESAKVDTAKLQNNKGKLPTYQTRVINASEHDPEIVAALKYNPLVQAEADLSLATSTIGFFEPSHLRYHRNQGIPGSSYEINLFMCPTTAGNSRVFLFTPFEKFLSKETGKEYRPSGLMQRSANKLFGRTKQAAFPAYLGHMLAHQIFDGDGIFLNKQGDRMRRAEATYKNYNTPASADLLVNAFRRWLDKSADNTRAAGQEQASSAATGGNIDTYNDNRPRSELLDRYASHTAKCQICLAALKEMKEKRDRLSVLSTALTGATGASGVLLVCTSICLLFTRVLVKDLAWRGLVVRSTLPGMLSTVLACAASWLGVKKIVKQRMGLDAEIQKFYFEDYIHAEKD